MAVKLRLQRFGRKGRPFYHIVAADSRAPRDGKYIERIGSYNPITIPATIELDSDKAFDWLDKGAQPTNTVKAILSYKGVLYRKHLQRGVKKGALTQEQADANLAKWIEEKEGVINKHKQSSELKRIKEQADKDENERKYRSDKAAAKVAQVTAPEPVEEVAAADETPSEVTEG